MESCCRYDPPPVAVVIPTWNGLHLLRECLSALWAGGEEFQVRLVDNGSMDGTREWFKQVARPGDTCHRFSQNVGFTAAVNVGMAGCLSEWIVLLNNDCLVRPGWCEALLAAGERDPKIGIVGAKLLAAQKPDFVVHAGAIAPAMHIMGNDNPDFDEPRQGFDDYVTFALVGLRRRMVEEIGPLDEQFVVHCSDSDYCYRAREAGWLIAYEPKFSGLHYQESTVGQYREEHPDVLGFDQKRFREKWAHHLAELRKTGLRV